MQELLSQEKSIYIQIKEMIETDILRRYSAGRGAGTKY